MTIAERNSLNDATVKFIIQARYRLRFCGVHRGKWRKFIANEHLERFGVGHADEFVSAWEWLEKRGLIY